MSFLLLPPGFVGFRRLATKARCERESSLLLESESVVRCVWWVGKRVWMIWVKTWWTIIKYWWTCIGNLQPYIGILLYPCIPLTTKHTQSIRWKPVASTNHTERYLAGFGCHLRRRQQRLEGLDGLIHALKFGWGDEVYAYWCSRPTLKIAHEVGAFTHRRATSTLMKLYVRFCYNNVVLMSVTKWCNAL